MVSKRVSSYSQLAAFYDLVVGDKASRILFLRQAIQRHCPHARSILELACGTGTLIAGLSRWYDVSGIDLSPDMAQRARKKLPSADIRIGNMASCNFDRKFDVVLCVYDSINHLLAWELWQSTIETAHRHLRDGGLFIFDVNTPERHDLLVRTRARGHEIGQHYLLMEAGREDSKFKWTLRVFEKLSNDLFRLHEIVVYEKAFPFDQIVAEVSSLFEITDIADADGLEACDANWRPFIVCSKL